VKLGRIGVWSSAPAAAQASRVREELHELEELGYGAVWWSEGFAKECLSTAALLLSWSRSIAVASGIANIWARDPVAMANGGRALADAHPGRFVLGIGVSHRPAVERRGQEYGAPVPTMRAYLDAMEAAPYLGHEPEEPAPVVLAALGPKMLDLARDRTAGAHPYFVPVEHTAFARQRLGEGKVLAVEQAVVVARDEADARTAAEQHLEQYLSLENYRRNLDRFGVRDEDAFDRLIAWGSPEQIAARVQAHLQAGADHVCVQPLPAGDFQVEQLRELAPALLAL
jgi:probable F420-dependent oxidoreductase